MGFLFRSKSDGEAKDNRNFRELKSIKRALSTNGRKPEIRLSRNISMSYDFFTTGHNMNVLLLGGSDEARIAKHIEQNLTAFNRNYIITDKDTVLYEKYASQLIERGYTVSLTDLNEPVKSGYNPMSFVFDDKSAGYLVSDIMANIGSITPSDSKGKWEDAEASLLFAVILAVSEKNSDASLHDVLNVIRDSKQLDELFKSAGARALSEYNKFRQNIRPETQKGVLLSLSERLSVFEAWSGGLSREECESDIKEFIFGRRVLFINLPKNPANHLSAGLLIRQIISAIMNEMIKIGIFRPQHPLHFILNDMESIGRIAGIDDILENAQLNLFGFSMFLSSAASFPSVFGDNWKHTVNMFDSAVCLSLADEASASWISTEHVDGLEGIEEIEDEDVKEMLHTLEESRVLIKIRDFTPVKDEV